MMKQLSIQNDLLRKGVTWRPIDSAASRVCGYHGVEPKLASPAASNHFDQPTRVAANRASQIRGQIPLFP
jgi:hypothetical protein